MRRTLVVGSINMDIVNRVRSHPQPGETIQGMGVSYYPGGKGANQAVAVAQSGVLVRMLGAVGDDEFSDPLLSNLSSYDGVETSFVRRVPGSSGLAFIIVDEAGENSIIIEKGSNASLVTQHIAENADTVFANVDTLLVQNEIPPAVTRFAIQLAHARGIRVIFNPAPVAGVTVEWLENVDVVVVNESEAQILSDVRFRDFNNKYEAARRAIEILLHAGAKSAIVTLGSDGSLYGMREGEAGEISFITQSAFKVEVVDSTAAGDTFVGSFSARLGDTKEEVKAALQFASAASALAVTKHGAQSSIPTISEVSDFLSTGQV